MILSKLLTWGVVGLGALSLFLGTLLYIQTQRLDLTKREHALYVKEVTEMGERAQKAADERARKEKEAKSAADKKYKKDLAVLGAELKRMRDNRGDGVPPIPPDTRRPDLICFDRAEYKRAYGELVAEVRGLADEGTKNTLALDNAKEWARE